MLLDSNAGFVWIWPGPGAPPELPGYAAPPRGFTVHAEIEVEVPVEHGLLMEVRRKTARMPDGWRPSIPSAISVSQHSLRCVPHSAEVIRHLSHVTTHTNYIGESDTQLVLAIMHCWHTPNE